MALASVPETLVILGMNTDRVIVGTLQRRGANGLFSGFYAQIDGKGNVSGVNLLDHRKATDRTDLQGISDNGFICGQYDDKYPFVYQLYPGPNFTYQSYVAERK